MAKLKVYTYPDQILTKKSEYVADVGKSYFDLIDGMLETMYDYPGVGLAAVQVGVLKRLIVMDTEYEVEEVDGVDIIQGKKPKIIFNPEIIYREGTTKTEEGCLSVPRYYADVERALKIKVKYQDENGLEQIVAAEGLQSVCFQHEIDHLEGKLFIEKLSPLKREFAQKKLIKARKLREG